MKKTIRQVIVHALLPLLAGITIYLLFRRNSWLHQHLFPVIEGPVVATGNPATKILAYNLPDFCWAYSFTSALLIWNKHSHRQIKYLPLFILAILLASEVLQYWAPDYFTFDWIDMLATFIGFSLSYLANRT